MSRTRWLASAAFLTFAIPAFVAPAQAQDAGADQAAQGAEAPAEAGEIIVTATRREESLSDVPIAISAVSGETLQATGASDIRQLGQVAPSLLVSGATSEVNFSARIRGVGTVGENAGLESSVGLFIDGVYRSRTGVGLSELGDIERVEVLRGPQGTLFGKNSTAGLINVVTKGPSFDFEGKGSVTYGNFDQIRVDGSITGPLSETIAAKLDAVYQKRDGFIKNDTPGEKDINDRDRYLIRAQLLFKPNDAFSLRLIGDYSERNEICCGAPILSPVRNVTRNPDGTLNIGANTILPIITQLGANLTTGLTTGKLFNRRTSTTPGFNYVADTEDYGVSAEANLDLGAVKLTSVTAYRDFKNRQGQDQDFNRLDVLRRTALDREFELFTQELRLQGELFNGRVDWLVGAYYADEKLTTSDNSTYGVDADRVLNCLAVARGFTGSPGSLNLALSNSTCSNQPATVFPGFQGFGSLVGKGVASRFRQDSRNYAFFTHNVIDIIEDKLSLTLGARYTNERKSLDSTFIVNNPACSLLRNLGTNAAGLAALACAGGNNDAGPGFAKGSPGTKRNEDEFTGTAVLSFKPVDRLLTYVSFSRGFKAGGFNLDPAGLDAPCVRPGVPVSAACTALLNRPANTIGNGRVEAADLQFASEKVNAYEIGAKFDGRGFNLNIAAFYQTYKNFQLNTFNGLNFQVNTLLSCKDDLNGADMDTSNATGACAPGRTRAGVESKGVEVEAVVNPITDVTVNMGLTYSDTKYRRNLVGAGGIPLDMSLFQLPGRQISNAPKYVVTSSIAYAPEIGSSGLSALFYLDGRFQSDTNTGSDLDAEKIQDGFLVVNGRIGLFGPDKKWGVEIFGQNLFNKRFQQIGADGPFLGGGTIRGTQAFGTIANQLFIAFPGEPRTYGITLRGKF